MPATRLPRPPSGPPDASMGLLNELLRRPLDPGYAAAAERRAAAGESTPRWGRSPVAVVTAVMLGLLFAVSASTLRTPPGSAAQERAVLVERIEDRRTAGDAQEDQVRELQGVVAELEAPGRSTGAPGGTQAEIAAAAAVTAVQGPGLTIILDDAPGESGSAAGGDPRNAENAPGRIVARDLQAVTNALWAAGADGIAVNGHRLTATSSIRFAGAAILVGYRPLTRPYTVSAIAGPAAVAAFEQGEGGAYLDELRRAYQARAEIKAVSDVRLPAGSVLDLRHAKPLRSESASPMGPTASGASS